MRLVSPDCLSISQSFARELSLASQGETTSVPFVKNPLPEYPLVQPDQVFQAFVIGGTQGSILRTTLFLLLEKWESSMAL